MSELSPEGAIKDGRQHGVEFDSAPKMPDPERVINTAARSGIPKSTTTPHSL